MSVWQSKGEFLGFWRGANFFGGANLCGATCAHIRKLYAQKREENA